MSLSVVGGPTAFTGTPDALSGVMFRVMTPLFHQASKFLSLILPWRVVAAAATIRAALVLASLR